MRWKRWNLPDSDPQRAAQTAALAGQLSLPELACGILQARGFETAEQIRDFLGGDTLCDPFLMRDMDRAVARIRRALEQGELIAIYGDFDCDGVTSTVLLYSYLESVGANVAYYIPDREEEGYGMNCAAVDTLAQNQVQLIITVDNGVAAAAEVAHAAELGIDVVITDHHQPPRELPQAVAVVDPHRADCPYPFKDLAGVGVTFKLVCALEAGQPGESGAGREMLEYYSELAALGTVADVVPLCGENRLLVRAGLKKLRASEQPGLCALIEIAGLRQETLTSESLAFGLAPRLNAAGRVGRVDSAIDLLMTEDPEEAAALAAQIDCDNTNRKNIEAQIVQEIERQLCADASCLKRRVLLFSGEGYRHGVIGIVASRLTERFGKPCFVVGVEGNEARGSCRGVPGFSVVEALTACSHLLSRFGGHTQAGGFSLAAADLPAFSQALEEFAARRYPVMPIPELNIDRAVQPGELTLEALRALEVLEPFGAGNSVPLFALLGLRLETVSPIGNGRHLRLTLSQGQQRLGAVWFGMTPEKLPFLPGDVVDLAVQASVSEYRGVPQVSVQVREMRYHTAGADRLFESLALYECVCRGEALSPPQRAQALPTREDTAAVYRALRRWNELPCEVLQWRLVGQGLDYCRLCVALDVLCELGLAEHPQGDFRLIRLTPVQGKVDLSASRLIQRLQA